MTRREFKEKCIELRHQDLSLKEISQVLSRPKTSVYFHIKNMPKTNFLLARIKQENHIRLNRIRPNLRGISWKGRHCKRFEKWTPGLVNLVAHSIFDGAISKSGVVYYNSNTVLVDNFKTKMKLVYSHGPTTYNFNNVTRVCYHSAELRDMFEGKREELCTKILTFDVEKQRAFLKAFFDDEGCITFAGRKRIVRGYQHNDETLFLIQKLLKNFDIESKVDTGFHEIVISRRTNVEKFAHKVNFTPGIKVNAKRSNSIWGRGLEKRHILEMAISSYL